MRILLAEDDARMAALVRRGLSEEGYSVEVAGTGPAAFAMATRPGGWDAMVLDVMLPRLSGVDVLRRVRAAGHATPVLMLTARDAAADVVLGLDAGADDYLTKPFSFEVLLARLRALTRRAPSAHATRIECGDLRVDTGARTVTRGGASIVLTRTEFNLLEYLIRRAGNVVPRERLIESVWGYERDVESNTLDAFIRLLRQKIDTSGAPPLIHTVRGVGYVLRQHVER